MVALQKLISKKKKKRELCKIFSAKTELLIGCHDISEGGIALALAELCIANKKGIEITLKKESRKISFGEDQSRYLLIINKKKNLKL